MRELSERAWFRLCLTLGRLLRAGRYSNVHVGEYGQRQVRKYRRFYAPLLVAVGGPLMRMLDTGVRILAQREWQERERRLYRHVHNASIGIEPDGTLVLPRLAGDTLATLLEDPALEDSVRKDAIARAVTALSELHRLGFTHGDAMAENVMIDLEAGVAHWFDFETVHDPDRPVAWCRADDVRALLASCLLRTDPGALAGTFSVIVDGYGDEEVTSLLVASFTPGFRRQLIFHLGQAWLSYESFREIGRVLTERPVDGASR